jgi:hypothetical protein
MAVSLQKAGGSPNTYFMEFFADLITDIATLPTMTTKGTGTMSNISSCPMGSTCFCIENLSGYILGSNGWNKI